MSKLFELKDWLTLSETAKHLTTIIKEEVSEADVLRLAINGDLKISIQFLNGAGLYRLTRVQVTPEEEEEMEVESQWGNITFKHPAHGKVLYLSDEFYQLDGVCTLVEGIWDFLLLGGTEYYLEHKYQMLTGGPNVTLQSDPVVEDNTGNIYCLF